MQTGSQFAIYCDIPKVVTVGNITSVNPKRVLRFAGTIWWRATIGESVSWKRWNWFFDRKRDSSTEFWAGNCSWARVTSIAQTSPEGNNGGFLRNVKWDEGVEVLDPQVPVLLKTWSSEIATGSCIGYSADYPRTKTPLWPIVPVVRSTAYSSPWVSRQGPRAEIVSVDTRGF
jgi:hypothetical protein